MLIGANYEEGLRCVMTEAFFCGLIVAVLLGGLLMFRLFKRKHGDSMRGTRDILRWHPSIEIRMGNSRNIPSSMLWT